jgi:hypothetical protein
VIGTLSDRQRRPRLYLAVPMAVLGVGLIAGAAATQASLVAALVILTLAGFDFYAYLGPFWTVVSQTLPGRPAGGSMGLINALGNLGGFTGPFVVGYLDGRIGGFVPGFVFLGAGALVVAALALPLRVREGAPLGRSRCPPAAGERQRNDARDRKVRGGDARDRADRGARAGAIGGAGRDPGSRSASRGAGPAHRGAGVRAAGQPLVGWRLWRLHDGRLRSWVVGHDWEAGANEARCLAGGPLVSMRQPAGGRCDRSPGTDCRCGLWALWDFGGCVRKAREESQAWDGWNVVIGLMAGWGTVAIHGEEGFRCQYAMVRCLFTDAVADRAGGSGDGRPGWWHRLAWCIRSGEPGDRRLNSLRRAADHYGVPLLSLSEALHMGVLGELGVPRNRIKEVAAELATG